MYVVKKNFNINLEVKEKNAIFKKKSYQNTLFGLKQILN